jgi:drug/metabolite transporter (DMT)-like permease
MPGFSIRRAARGFALVLCLAVFQGRTATFAGVVNRLTSLLAGTTATLLLAWIWKQRPPSIQDWASLVFILIAVGFLTRAEKHRSSERARALAPVAGAGEVPRAARPV